jgi:hypothetical protein
MYRLGLGTVEYPQIDAAIQQFEGWAPGSVSYQNNNPGNLQYASWEAAYGCSAGGAGGFALCPSYAAGQAIEDHLVSVYVGQGDSLSDLLAAWCPPGASGGCTQQQYENYVAYVVGETGYDPSLPISGQLADGAATLALPDDSGVSTPPETSVASLLSGLFLNTDGSMNWLNVGLAAGVGLLAVWALA